MWTKSKMLSDLPVPRTSLARRAAWNAGFMRVTEPSKWHVRAATQLLVLTVCIVGCNSADRSDPAALCGNGVVEGSEKCDDGNNTNGDACEQDCAPPRCGNHYLDRGEKCDDGNINDGDGCEADCTEPRCGNHIVDSGEQCDDGNFVDGDQCDHNCTPPACGNGIIDGSEQCDDGNGTDADGCERDCSIPGCGNGILDAGEACDDGNTANSDACDNNCTVPGCGNGMIDSGEACDDGNDIEGDSCDTNCTFPACANAIKDPAEQCDDGNLVDADTCEQDCTLPSCGNGIQDISEACDDGNDTDADGCEHDCTAARCGNSIRDPGEACDDGNATNGDACDTNCTAPACGNVITDPGEQCDDGNHIDADGCEHDCTTARCGNAIRDPGETCDDGNANEGDTCDSNCTLPACSNGVVDPNEQCDDGNLNSDDGCDVQCGLECGNGVRGGNEECDDNNRVGGDGCEPDCTLTCGHGTFPSRLSVDAASGRCFAEYDAKQLSYQQAAAYCRGLGGHLPIATSSAENDAIKQAAATKTVWLGGSNLANHDAFEWITGAAMSFTAYGAGQPATTAGSNCLRIAPDGTWSSAACGAISTTGTTCEFELFEDIPHFSTVGAEGMKHGDFNGDGRVDVVFPASAGSPQTAPILEILLGDGTGAFSAPVDVLPGIGTYSAVAVGDLDGDGNADLVFAGYEGFSSNPTVSTALGNGDGTFSTPVEYALSGRAYDVTLGDVNGDGRLDIVVANLDASNNSQLQILLATSTTAFAMPMSAAIYSGSAGTTTLVDLNHDGKLDVVTSSQVALGNGAGGFGTPTYFANGGASGLTAGDLDGDGNVDLAWVSYSSDRAYVAFGNGSGGFAMAVAYIVGDQPWALSAADLDGDGDLDLAIANGDESSVAVMVNDGSGGFAAIKRYEMPDGFTRAVATIDIDSDGLTDLVSQGGAGDGTGRIAVRLQRAGSLGADLSFGLHDPYDLSPTSPTALCVGDFDRDSHVDIATANYSSFLHLGATAVVRGTGTRALQPPIISHAPVMYGLVAADFDGDGYLDVADATSGADLDHDGRPDLVGYPTINTTFNQTLVQTDLRFGDGLGGFGTAATQTFQSTPARTSIYAALATGNGTFANPMLMTVDSQGQVLTVDVDHDTFDDIIIVNTLQNKLTLQRNQGNGTFGPALAISTEPRPGILAPADINSDGAVDLVVVYLGGGLLIPSRIGLLIGDGAGGFVLSPVSISIDAEGDSIAAVDINHDGHVDLLYGTDLGTVGLMLGAGDGTFGPITKFAIGSRANQPLLADLDEDGHLDLVMRSGYGVSILMSPR